MPLYNNIPNRAKTIIASSKDSNESVRKQALWLAPAPLPTHRIITAMMQLFQVEIKFSWRL